jgi:hypothetical protein
MTEALLPDSVKALLAGFIAIVFTLGWLARRNPKTAWLQAFRLPVHERTPEQHERRRRSQNRMVGLEIVAVGLGLPVFYMFMRAMWLSDFEAVPTLLVGAVSDKAHHVREGPT